MKRVFISQPMRDKTASEIILERNKAISDIVNKLGEDVYIIDTYLTEGPMDVPPLWYIGKSLELMSTADIVYFTEGWERYRGCRVEHLAAHEYDIKIMNYVEN